MTQQLFDAAFNCGSVRYPADCGRFCAIAASRLDLTVSLHQAEVIWEYWSGLADAQWLSTQEPDAVVQAIRVFMRHRLEGAV